MSKFASSVLRHGRGTPLQFRMPCHASGPCRCQCQWCSRCHPGPHQHSSSNCTGISHMQSSERIPVVSLTCQVWPQMPQLPPGTYFVSPQGSYCLVAPINVNVSAAGLLEASNQRVQQKVTQEPFGCGRSWALCTCFHGPIIEYQELSSRHTRPFLFETCDLSMAEALAPKSDAELPAANSTGLPARLPTSKPHMFDRDNLVGKVTAKSRDPPVQRSTNPRGATIAK